MLMQKLLSGGEESKLYSDEVFSAYLRTGTGADVTVTTGIDMTKGYMLWSKGRSGATDHAIYDSARGVTLDLASNTTAAQTTQSTGLKAVSATGHTIGSLAKMNTSSATYVDFVFRKAPKFFDVVTINHTNGVADTVDLSSLGTVGMVYVKQTTGISSWWVWHRSLGNGQALFLEQTGTATADDSITISGTTLTWKAGRTTGTYVAYLFAHDTSADGIIQCGSFTTDGSGNATVNLGWEPQYTFNKAATTTSNWNVYDSMRGMPATSGSAAFLKPNASDAEGIGALAYPLPNATGFTISGGSASQTYIYLAIRRPNKPPTSGTQVYNAIARTGTGAAATVTGVGFAPDLLLGGSRRPDLIGQFGVPVDRLRGNTSHLVMNNTTAETAVTNAITGFLMDGVSLGADLSLRYNGNSYAYINHFFRRATGFMDVVCYTGTGSATTVAHNLGVAPELMIVKARGATGFWCVYHASQGATKYAYLNTTAIFDSYSGYWNNTAPTASVFTIGADSDVSTSGRTYVAYLFASLPGISKVFSFTGNGTNQNIECGFSTGARFVLLKRTDSTGNWLVADTARGLVSGNDPSLALNSTAAEVTTVDWIDPYAGGFNIVQESTNNANVNGATYIGLAIA